MVKYIIRYRVSAFDDTAPYTHFVDVTNVNVLTKVIGGLYWHTEYDFVVAAARAGYRGEGPPSPKVKATTRCDGKSPIHIHNLKNVFMKFGPIKWY